ncbi:hypothetical protein ACFL5T_01710, partial [Gemmatimonadota bacterium]
MTGLSETEARERLQSHERVRCEKEFSTHEWPNPSVHRSFRLAGFGLWAIQASPARYDDTLTLSNAHPYPGLLYEAAQNEDWHLIVAGKAALRVAHDSQAVGIEIPNWHFDELNRDLWFVVDGLGQLSSYYKHGWPRRPKTEVQYRFDLRYAIACADSFLVTRENEV